MTPTTTLETSKLLKEAGFPQKSEFWYLLDSPIFDQDIIWHTSQLDWKKIVGRKYVSAFLSDELLKELPKEIPQHLAKFNLTIQFFEGKCGVAYVWDYGDGMDILSKNYFHHESLPEALSKMYIWLAKEGLLKGDKG